MRTRIMWLLIGTLAIAGLLASSLGCSQPASSPAPKTTTAPTSGPAPTTSAAPKPAPGVKPIVLKVQSHGGATNAYRMAIERVIKELETKAQGRIKVDYYPNDALVAYDTGFESVSGGIVDIVQGVTTQYVGQLGAPAIFNHMPFNFDVAKYMANYRKIGYYDYMEQRFEKYNIRLLSHLVQPSQDMIWRKEKPVRKMEDLKGLIVHAPPGFFPFVTLMGGVPINLTSAERYDALQRRTIDMAIAGASIAVSSRYWEVAQGVTLVNMAAGSNMHLINLDVYKKLPADLVKILEDALVATEAVHAADTVKAVEADLELLKKNRMEVVYLSTEERERWIKAALPTYDDIKKEYPKEWEEFNAKWWPSLR